MEQVTVDIHNIAACEDAAFKNKDVAFCCLGTTRRDAGSAVIASARAQIGFPTM